MTDKSKKVEEQNRLREWKRQNHEEAKKLNVQAKKSKEIIVQVDKSSKWKGLRTIFSPFTSYHVFDFVEK
jgi:hypothetical protein